MINILLNLTNFHEAFAFRKLRHFIKRRHNVLIIPLAYHEDFVDNGEEFAAHFVKGQPEIDCIVDAFAKFKIPSKQIKVLNYYSDTPETIAIKFKRADILFFPGGYPDKAMYRIDKYNLRELIKSFDGIVMGASAGAMIQFDHFHVTPEEEGQIFGYCDGLGLLSGFDIEVHYRERIEQVDGVLTDLTKRGLPICIMHDNSGLIVKNGKRLIIGDAFWVDKDDVDVFQFISEDRHQMEAARREKAKN